MSALIGCGTGILGTGLGGVFAAGIRRIRNVKRTEMFLLGLSGGVMAAVVVFELIPEAAAFSDLADTALYFASGAIITALLSKLIPKKSGRLGIMMLAGIALHNFPEGLAVGAGLSEPDSFGLRLGFLIMLHDVPEGLAIGIPLKNEGMSCLKTITMCALSGLPTAIGAAAGYIIGGISPVFVGGSVAFAAGAMLYLAVLELIPECIKKGALADTAVSVAAGFAAGAVCCAVL